MEKFKKAKDWWKASYFYTGMVLYILFMLNRIYGGIYDTRHEFLNGFTQEIFVFISKVPVTIFIGLFLFSLTGMYILERKTNLMGYTKVFRIAMVLVVFYTLLLTGLFEPIRKGVEYLLNTKLLDVRIIEIITPLEYLEKAEFSLEIIVKTLVMILVNVLRYFLYLNVSVLYLLGSIGIAALLGSKIYSILRTRLKLLDIEREEIKLEAMAGNVIPFRKKSV